MVTAFVFMCGTTISCLSTFPLLLLLSCSFTSEIPLIMPTATRPIFDEQATVVKCLSTGNLTSFRVEKVGLVFLCCSCCSSVNSSLSSFLVHWSRSPDLFVMTKLCSSSGAMALISDGQIWML